MPLVHPKIDFKLILCDAAQTDALTGKLHMLGAGWTTVGTPTPPHAVALMVQVPWDRANEKLPIRLELLSADGHPVLIPGPTGSLPVLQEAELEVGRPPGVARGSALSASFALNIGPLPLSLGRYEWRARVDQDENSEFFQVMAVPAVNPRPAP